jgi:hypothetical protein
MPCRWLACALLWAGCAAGKVISVSDAGLDEADATASADAPVDAAEPGAPDAHPDAAIAIGDARPADARPVDARPVDARPADGGPADAGCEIDVLENGDFEQTTGSGDNKTTTPWLTVELEGGKPWLIASAAELDAIGASTANGGYAAHLGGGDGYAHVLLTSVTIPAATRRLDLAGQFWVRSADGVATIDDQLQIDFTDAEGFLVDRLATLSEADKGSGYVGKTFRGGQHGGQTLVLAFKATTNGSAPTDFFFDDLRLVANVCN